jgi:hypothetical protein
LTHNLQNRAARAMADIDAARTEVQKFEARREGFAVHGELQKHLADEQALDAFRKSPPKSMAGVYKGEPVADHPMQMVGPAGTKITAPVELPNGEKAIPNAAYQITVHAHHVPAMRQRGFVLANSVITPLGEKYPVRDPAIPNGT